MEVVADVVANVDAVEAGERPRGTEGKAPTMGGAFHAAHRFAFASGDFWRERHRLADFDRFGLTSLGDLGVRRRVLGSERSGREHERRDGTGGGEELLEHGAI